MMKQVIIFLERLQNENIIEGYALGGAWAAQFYLEPFPTWDMDFFVFFKENNSILLDLGPIFKTAKEMGYSVEDDGLIMIENKPVQLIPANKLQAEAIKESLTKTFETVDIKVFSAEHLIAESLRCGRPKDMSRIGMFLDGEFSIDYVKLNQILDRFKLMDKWNKLIKQRDTNAE
jgi:hypothetical protein